ncbi:MAG: hypothetical protein ER33_11905 [Cyanobium sp. CACIAM 14]|nr:MAG: hypothetical protein ER33_11905 [Cyanobium sp. CACIAM 14]
MLQLHPPRHAQGFVLPLAMGASMVLLLGSLSAHTAGLQLRLQGVREQQQRRAEDRLSSAAQELLAELNRNHPCLLALPLERWNGEGLVCASAQALANLQAGRVLGASFRLVGWRPDPTPAELLLELEGGACEPPRRGAFAVSLAAPQPPLQPQLRVSDVQLLGLRGVEP